MNVREDDKGGKVRKGRKVVSSPSDVLLNMKVARGRKKVARGRKKVARGRKNMKVSRGRGKKTSCNFLHWA